MMFGLMRDTSRYQAASPSFSKRSGSSVPSAFTLRTLAWATVAWCLLGALQVAVLHFYMPISGQGHASWRALVSWAAPATLLWIPFTPVVITLSRRFPVIGRDAVRSGVVHLGAAVLAHVITASVVFAFNQWLSGRTGPGFGTVLLQGLLFDVIRYGMLAAAVHATDHYRMYRRRDVEALRLAAELGAARLQVLKMQLQPHFLFNALHAVSELVYRDPRLADRALSRLADLLRMMLATVDHDDSSLADELAFIESYLEIERIRRDGALEVEIEACAAALQTKVPNLVLQPLVENALRHGLRTRSVGAIRITAELVNGDLRLAVEDDGRGLPAEGHVEGLGLGSTRTRLQALYGDRHRLSIQPRTEGGTRVELTIPADEADKTVAMHQGWQ